MSAFSPLPLDELVAALRQRGALVAAYEAGAGQAFADAAAWLEVSLTAHLDQPLTIEQARRESNWSYEALRRRLKEEPSLNVGEPGAPLICRRDLSRLGAPRGPRGPYGPRKAKATAAPEAGASSTARGAPAEPLRRDAEERQPPPIVVQRVAGSDHPAAEESRADVSERPAASGAASREHRTAPAGQPAAKRPTARPAGRRPRRNSADERFADICALASRG